MPETAGPIIYQANNAASKKGFNPKGAIARLVTGLVFVGLIAFIGYQIFTAVKLLLQPADNSSAQSNVISDSTPTLSLSSDTSDIQVGSQVQIPISVNTSGKNIIGVDVVIKYDPEVFQATNSGVLKVFQPGKVFGEYPIASADNTRGEIRVSGIASTGQNGFNGIGVLGTLSLKTLKSGQSTLKFDYLPDGTTDSNMIEDATGVDVLGGVRNLDLIIR